MEIHLLTFLAAAGVITVGAVLQASTGMGTGIMIVPLLALIDIDFVPGPVVLASMALSTLMAWRGRRHIDFVELGPLLAGLTAGIVTGAFGLAAIPPGRVGILFGTIIIAAVAVSVAGLRIPINRRNLVGAGAAAGLMGAFCGVGGPPLAILYQDREGPALRSTLAFVYIASSVLILGMLAMLGRFGPAQAGLGVYLIPGYVAGYVVARPLARYLDRGYSRVVVLAVSGLSAIMLIVRSL